MLYDSAFQPSTDLLDIIEISQNSEKKLKFLRSKINVFNFVNHFVAKVSIV